MSESTAPARGTFVDYIASDGKRKLALVTANEASVEEGTNIPTLTGDTLHIEVHSPSGKIYARQSVAKLTEEGQTNVWTELV